MLTRRKIEERERAARAEVHADDRDCAGSLEQPVFRVRTRHGCGVRGWRVRAQVDHELRGGHRQHPLPGVRLHISVKEPEQLDEIPQDPARGPVVGYRRDTHGHGRYYGDS